jgi:hypothetical protein
MLAVLTGLALVIVAVVLWLGHLTTAHAVAIGIGLVGVLLVVYAAVPASALLRRR